MWTEFDVWEMRYTISYLRSRIKRNPLLGDSKSPYSLMIKHRQEKIKEYLKHKFSHGKANN